MGIVLFGGRSAGRILLWEAAGSANFLFFECTKWAVCRAFSWHQLWIGLGNAQDGGPFNRST